MDYFEKHRKLQEALEEYFAALRAGSDQLRILEARSKMARLIDYQPEKEDG